MQTNGHAVDVGVIGVGSMGRHHARVYSELPTANLVGVADVDTEAARSVAGEYGVDVVDSDELLGRVDAVSIAVPTEFHYALAMSCIDANVGMLIEKPVVGNLERAAELQSRVDLSDVVVQVGHIERFNPAVQQLTKIIDDLTVLSIRAHRLGPEPDRRIADSAVMDLMIHDVDIVMSLLGRSPASIHGVGVDGNRHASAMLDFGGGTMATLTASRKTQRKVRRLEVIAEECYVELDYQDQSIEIHRDSVPEYVEQDGDVRFVHESIVERPRVDTSEPLRKELESFVETVSNHGTPEVTLQDGIEALEFAEEIERAALETETVQVIGDD